MKPTLQTLKGFRDFLPSEKRKRDFVLKKVVEVFEKFGFEPLQTPMLEYADLILDKYGEEADKLVYSFTDRGGRKVALPYDQTVPTARVLAQYKNELPKYFRRYQIQSVFRADKPQKGRYREFTQCDIDIFGSTSPLSDAEIIACTYFTFKNLGFPNIIIKINDRKTLIKTASPLSNKDLSTRSIIRILDKRDKIGEKGIANELANQGLIEGAIKKILKNIKESKKSKILEQIAENAISLGVPEKILQFDPTLARGLDYYTGMIFEVIIPEYKVGSFGGGGRYDKLIGQLSGQDVPAVGVAFGFDRMVEAAEKLNLIPQETNQAKALISVFDKATQKQSLKIAAKLRQANITTEVYPAQEPLDKQLKYADKKGIPFVVIIGPDEAKANKVTLKDLKSGKQETLSLDQAISQLKD